MAESQDLKGYLIANQRLHVTLYAAANNPEPLNMIRLSLGVVWSIDEHGVSRRSIKNGRKP